jgi:hypothetical protein
MAALVETEFLDSSFPTDPHHPLADVGRRERPTVLRAEDERVASSARAELVLVQVVAEDAEERNVSARLVALRLDLAFLLVPAVPDVDG